MSRIVPRLVPALVALGLALPRAAHAEAGDAQKKAAAQVLFDDARQLTAQGKYADACPKLVESNRLDPATGTKFYLADCLEHTGKLASAWTYYLEAAEEAHREGTPDKEKFAGDRAAALKPRLPKLAVNVSVGARAANGLSVKRDGEAIGEGQWGSALPVDLGDHTVVAAAPGKRSWEAHLEVTKEGSEATVEIPPLEDEPAVVAPPPLKPVIEPPPVPELPPPPPPSSAQRIAGFAVGGAGIAGIVVGAVFGAQAISKKKESNQGGHCDAADTCDAEGHALRVSALHAATASTVVSILGGVAVAGGVVLVLTAPSSKPKSAAPALAIGPGSVSLLGRF